MDRKSARARFRRIASKRLAKKSKEEQQQLRISQILKKIKDCEEQTSPSREKWRENYTQFAVGSQFTEKEDWQSQISLGRFESRVRNATASARNILINQPDWFYLCPTNPDDELSRELRPTFTKLIKYFLHRAKFGKHASTFLLCAFISMGSAVLTWKPLWVQNPEYLAKRRRKQEQDEAAAGADLVANPPAGREYTEEEVLDSASRAMDSFQALLKGELLPERSTPEDEGIKPYIRIGVPQIEVINPENRFWDPSVKYMSESSWGAYRTTQRLSVLKMEAERGVYDKKQVAEIDENRPATSQRRMQESLYNRLSDKKDNGVIELAVYFGPIEDEDGNIEHERYGCVIAQDSIIIKEWEEYPYWEPPGHGYNPFVDAAVKEIPFRATGAGVGDNAVGLARALDSNVNLQVDAQRFNLIGFTVVDYNALVDKSCLEEGIEPGQWIEVRGKAKDAVEHVSLTNNIEAQSFPTNNMIDDAIDENMGVSEISMGGRTQRSRVTAQEINARSRGSEESISNTALDLEQDFLIPFLEKLFARILQFGLQEIESNPELSHQLSDKEKQLLQELGPQDRANILANFYNFKIKGFSSKVDRGEKLSRYMELLTVVNSGGPLGQMINPQVLMKKVIYEMGLDDEDADSLFATTGADFLVLENQLLMQPPQGHAVQVSDTDDHEQHLQSHTIIPNPTPAMMMHIQDHQLYLQKAQAAAQQSQQINRGQPPLQ